MKTILLAVAGVLTINILLVLLLLFTPASTTQLPPYPQWTNQEILVTVPLDTQLGQLFMIGHWSDTPVASTTALIKEYQLGGVVIMSAPENPAQIIDWTTQWNQAADSPLLIAIDQEGGPVTRLKGEQFVATGQKDIASVEKAYAIGQERGQELAQLGINMNFAPVLDTAVDPGSFMHSRTFPSDTDEVSLAAAMIRGLAESGVTAVVKHFPGHDDTNVDSHNELPVVNISQAELANFTQSFTDLITQNPPQALMTAHVQFPQIDLLPATLSQYFLTTYLRDELAYQGLIITDDMSMKAITSHYDAATASAMAIEAGADIVLLAAEPTDVEIIITQLIKQAKESPSLQKRIAGSYQRVMASK